MGLLDGRVAIVTGAGRGLGRAHALALAQAGAAVVVNDLDTGVDGSGSGDGAGAGVVAEIVAAGGEAIANGASVSEWDACEAIVDQAVTTYGRLDVVVNNAGVTRDRLLTSITEIDLDITLGVHLKGTVAMSHHACRYWRSEFKAGRAVAGRIVNTTSGSGMVGNPGQTVYAAAKAAIIGFTQSAAMEGSRYDVTANAISPLALTRMSQDVLVQPTIGGDDFNPLAPSNASGLVVYLSSSRSGWLTGQVLRVDGPKVIRMTAWTSGASYHSRDGGALDALELVEAMPRLFGAAPAGLAGLKS